MSFLKCIASLVLLLLVMPVLGDISSSQKDVSLHLKRGDKDAAKRALDAAVNDLDDLQESMSNLKVLRSMAQQYRMLGARSNAVELLKRSAEIAEHVDPQSMSDLLLELGHTLGVVGNHEEATQVFNTLLERIPAGNTADLASAYTNLLKAEVSSRDNLEVVSDIVSNFSGRVGLLTNTKERCGLELRFAGILLASQHIERFESVAKLLLENSLKGAKQGSNTKDQSYALGYLALLAEKTGHLSRALQLNREALSLALNGDSELRYRWQWQLGRVKALMGDRLGAIANYQQSVVTLGAIQVELLKGSNLTFRERVLPVYNELVDLLLQEATLASGNRQQSLLLEAQGTIEAITKSEVLDYFDDDCLLPVRTLQLDKIALDTAVIYPVLLSNRLVILSKTPGGIHQDVSSVTLTELISSVAEFRDFLETNSASIDEIQDVGGELYNAIIAPVAARLAQHKITRLVFVPASQLRMIPMSALYDGEQYLIQRYEIATTLGLNLTDPTALEGIKSKPLLGGVSESVREFDALPGVVTEISGINELMQGDVVLNEQFTVNNVAEKLRVGGYSVVHLATHGVFHKEASNSYLLTYDDKLTLDLLQATVGSRRFSGDPLDLLVLSACDTAAGDDQAALGLAGVSLKAGARSTVASLWPVSDEVTARLMQDFYKYLSAGKSKSFALRKAQLTLINDPIFENPNYWGPFLLIGNWM
jgi:CHAT domain-containing protein